MYQAAIESITYLGADSSRNGVFSSRRDTSSDAWAATLSMSMGSIPL